MADMKAQVKVTFDAANAKKSLDGLSEAVTGAKVEIEGISGSLNDTESSANNASESFEELGQQATGVQALSMAMDGLGKATKKLGSDLTKSITAPILALAGLSLKNLYDTGAIEGATGPAREFALSVQNLQKNIKALSLEIGAALAPAFNSVIGAINKVVTLFRSLDESTKSSIATFALIVAAIGPVLLSISGFISLGAKLIPIVSAIGSGIDSLASVLSTPIVIIGTLIAGIAGLVNVFIKLKQSGMDTAEALNSTFNLFVTGFNSYVVANLLKGISFITAGLSKLASFTGMSTKGIDEATAYVDGIITTLDKRFEASKSVVNDSLSSIGTSAGEAFTFGLSTKIGEAADSIGNFFSSEGSGGQLESEMGKTFDSAFKNIESLQANHLLSLEQAQFEHQKKMDDFSGASDSATNYEERLAKEREFMEAKHQLQSEDLLRTIEEERYAASAIQDLNAKRVAMKSVNEKAALEVTKLTQAQELELINLTNTQIEESTKKRWEKIEPYAQSFANGLTSAFMAVADGTKDLGTAFADFAKDFIKQITQMIIQAQLLKAIKSLTGLAFAEGGPVSTDGKIPQFATGGAVRGPGNGTSDSILARLSNGEFVSDAKTVGHFGLEFFHNLKKMARGGVPISPRSSLPNFADGGLVTNPNQAPQVVIENRGTPSEVVGSTYDPSSAVLTVIIDDLSKNGPMSKSMQSTFGVKRGGFR